MAIKDFVNAFKAAVTDPERKEILNRDKEVRISGFKGFKMKATIAEWWNDGNFVLNLRQTKNDDLNGWSTEEEGITWKEIKDAEAGNFFGQVFNLGWNSEDAIPLNKMPYDFRVNVSESIHGITAISGSALIVNLGKKEHAPFIRSLLFGGFENEDIKNIALIEKMLEYKKSSPNNQHWIFGEQAAKAHFKGWTNPDEIKIDNEGKLQYSLDGGNSWINIDPTSVTRDKAQNEFREARKETDDEEPKDTEGRSTTPPQSPIPNTSSASLPLATLFSPNFDEENSEEAENRGDVHTESSNRESFSSLFSPSSYSQRKFEKRIVAPFPLEGETFELENTAEANFQQTQDDLTTLTAERDSLQTALQDENNIYHTNYENEQTETTANLTEQASESGESINSFEINLETDNQEISQPELTFQQQAYFKFTKLIYDKTTAFDDWLPQVKAAYKEIYDLEVAKINPDKLSQNTKAWLHSFFSQQEPPFSGNAGELIDCLNRILAEIQIWKTLDNCEGLKTAANLQEILAWQGDNQIEVLNYIPDAENKKKTYRQLIEKELVKMEIKTETTASKPGWKSRLWNTTKNVVLAASLYGGGYYQGANSTTNQLSLSTDLIPYSPCSSLDLPVNKYNETDLFNAQQNLNQEWINKNLLDPVEVQNNYTKLEKERDQRPDITLIRYEELLKKEIEADSKSNLTHEEYDKIVKEKNEWKTEYEKAELKPANLPDDWEIKLNEWKEFKQRPDIITKEYEDLLLNQKPLDLPENWKEQLRRIADLERQIKDLELRPDITQNEWDIIQKERDKLREQLDFALDDLQHVISSNSTNENALQQAQQALTDAQKARDTAQNDLKTRTNELDEARTERDNRPDITQEEFATYQSPQQVEEINQQIENKYQGFINPNDQAKIIELANQAGYQFTQKELDEALETNNQNWINKGLINPHNDTDLKQANLIKKTAAEQMVKQEKEKYENWINPDDPNALKNANLFTKNELEATANQVKTQLQTHYQGKLKELKGEKKQLAKDKTKLQKELDQTKQNEELLQKANEKLYQEQKNNLNEINQLKAIKAAQTDLEKAQKAQQQAETDLNNLQTNYAKEQQAHTETKTALSETQTNLTQEKAEKQAIQDRLETINQQLNEVNEELIREKIKERKLAEDNTHLQTLINQLETDNQTKTTENSEWKTKHKKLHQEQQNKDNWWKVLVSILAGDCAARYTTDRVLSEQDIEELTKKIKELQEQNDQMVNHWRNHKCETTCLHNDYEAIKTDLGQTRANLNQTQKERDTYCQDRDNLQSQLTTANQEKQQREQQILHQINQDLNLNLKEPNLEQLITKIKELINKPPETIYEEYSNKELESKLNQAQKTITRLEKELGENNTPFGESLENIKELELNSLEELFKQTVDTTIKKQIKQATSYQQVVAARQAFLEKQLGKEQNKMQVMNYASNELSQPINKERIIWIGLLLVSLVSIGGLLVKLKGVKGNR